MFKYTSNQQRIKMHQGKIFGYIMEIAIYRDQFRVTLRNQLRVLKHNACYLRYLLVPLLLVLLPVALICMQIENRLGYAPLAAGQVFSVYAEVADGQPVDVQLTTSAGVVTETPALRAPDAHRVYWRCRLAGEGPQWLRFTMPDGSAAPLRRDLVTAGMAARFGPLQLKPDDTARLLYAAEPPLPDNSPLTAVWVEYQPAAVPLAGIAMPAVIAFFVLSLVFGFLVKPLVKVSI